MIWIAPSTQFREKQSDFEKKGFLGYRWKYINKKLQVTNHLSEEHFSSKTIQDN